MSDDLEVREQRTMRHDLAADDFRMGIRMMSLGPEGERWMDENAAGWRDHASLMDINVALSVSDSLLIRYVSPIELIKKCRTMLANRLAEEIINRLEPITSRYTRSDREPIRMDESMEPIIWEGE